MTENTPSAPGSDPASPPPSGSGGHAAAIPPVIGSGQAPLAGRFLLIDQIGAGGMGSVWRAWDLRQQRFVAAKVLGQHDGSMLLRFVREQSVRIQHPHVVAPHGWAAEDNLVVFTMDLVRGGSVLTLLGDHGPLPEDYVTVLLDQALQALDAVHSAGVVHRDIKPANLLLEATGTGRPHVRLGDFGVAALIDEVRLTRFPGAIGTDGYMAPEQLQGAPPDPSQDLYATGVVAIQMLTGLPPRQQRGAPEGRLQALLEAMTSEDPSRRPPAAAAALDYLRRLGVPPGAPWESDPEPPEVFDQLGDVDVPEVGQTGPVSLAAGSGGTAVREQPWQAASADVTNYARTGERPGHAAAPTETDRNRSLTIAGGSFALAIVLCLIALVLLFL